MKNFLVLVFLFISCLTIHAQRENIDSLKGLLSQAKPGYDQVDYIMGISREFLFLSERDSIDKYYEKGMAIAREYDDLGAQSNLMILQNFVAFVFDADGDKAIRITGDAVELAIASGDADAIAFAMYQHAENYIFEKGDYDRAVDILLTSVEQFDDNVTLKNKGNTYKNLGIVHSRLGEYEKAIDFFNKAIEHFRLVATNPDLHYRLNRVSAMYADGGLQNIGQALGHLGDCYQQMGRNTKAKEVFEEALAFCREYSLTDLVGWICGKLGKVYALTGNYLEALSYFQQGLRIFEASKIERDIAEFQMHIGDVYDQLQEYQKASDNYEKTYQFFKTKRDTFRMLEVATKLVHSYISLDLLEEADDLIKELEIQARSLENEERIFSVIRQSSEVQSKMGNRVEAIRLLQTVLTFAESRKDENLIAEIKTDLAGEYRSNGSNDDARSYASSAMELSTTLNRKDLISINHKMLSEIYEELGQYDRALNSYKVFHQSQSDILQEGAQSILREEQVRQDISTYKSEQEAAVIRARLLNVQNQLYLGLAIMLLILLVVAGYLMSELRKSKKTIEIRNTELSKLNQTKNRFFSIIAHDIRSPIIALEGVGEQVDYYLTAGKTAKLRALSNKIEDTAKGLHQLLNNLLNWALLQQNLVSNQPNAVRLGPAVEETVAMYKVSLEVKKLSVRFDIPDHISILCDESALHTILRNLIGNAIKYSNEGGGITIFGEETSDEVRIVIEDTGIGMSEDQLKGLYSLENKSIKGTRGEGGSGLGLILCKELLELNRGSLKIESSKDQGTTAIVTLQKSTETI